MSALNAKNDTTNLFAYKLGELTENNNKVLPLLSGKETKRFHLIHYAGVCEVMNGSSRG